MRKNISYNSAGSGKIRAYIWEGEAQPRAIVQIIHGIGEHALRYEQFAEFLNQSDIVVVAEDHMGHGKSISEDHTRGYFHGGWFAAIEDSVKLCRYAKKQYGNIPYFIFGHSMGSFMARTILAKYPEIELAGCIICGTGWQAPGLLAAAIPICQMVCKQNGEKNPSTLLDKMVFGGYNKRVEHVRTPSDWLTRDAAIVDAYNADRKCGFVPSAGLMRDMLLGIQYIQSDEALDQMNKTLPCFFIAGGDDPVGNYGKGVHQAANAFSEHGMENVDTKIYPLCRHEILNEINRQEVYKDVMNWIDSKI